MEHHIKVEEPPSSPPGQEEGHENVEKPKVSHKKGKSRKSETTSTNATDPGTPADNKPKRGGSKPILKISGIARIDNNLKPTLFAAPTAINQKNYYTDYLKKDEQIYFNRQWIEEQKRLKEKETKDRQIKEERKKAIKLKLEDNGAGAGGLDEGEIDFEEDEDDSDDEESTAEGARTLVIHFGSRNLRIGLASHVYPKTVPNVIAHKVHEDSGDMEIDEDEESAREELLQDILSDSFKKAAAAIRKDLKERMRFYKRRIIPNSHDLIVGFNTRQHPEIIPEHNDVQREEWTNPNELNNPPYFVGEKALKIPPKSIPKYKLFWPIRHGLFNEVDYTSPQQVLGDLAIIITETLEKELSIPFSHFKDYNVVILIPDLYDRTYVTNLIELLLDMRFAKVCIQQEAIAATFGAGISSACIIDIGAQKTSITCVEEGICISDSRINLKYGGDDMTLAFIKFLLESKFPYQSIDIYRNAYDWELANLLKHKFITANDADVAIQLYSFHQRSPDEATRKYDFKTFDEIMLATLGLFYPQVFLQDGKLDSKCTLFPRSFDFYDGKHNDPLSDAQINILKETIAVWGLSYIKELGASTASTSNGTTTSKINGNSNLAVSGISTPLPSSAPGTPAPEGKPSSGSANTAVTNNAANNASTASTAHLSAAQIQLNNQFQAAETIDHHAVASIALDHAIIESITQAAKFTSSKQNFYENLMVVGGGASKISGFDNLLTDRVGMWRTHAEDDLEEDSQGDIAIMPVPREMDPSLICWKGGSVLAKLKIVNELWITSEDWDLLGSRTLQYKSIFPF